MPSNLMLSDSAFPHFTGESTDEKVAKIQDYLFMLLEQLRYTLGNISTENFNEAGLKEFSNYVTEPFVMHLSDIDGRVTNLSTDVDGIFTRVSNAEGNVSSLSQTVYGLSLNVSNNGDSSSIQLTSNGVNIGSSGQITFNGLVKFTDLSNAGSTSINGANITSGTITGRLLSGCTIDCNITNINTAGLTSDGQIRFLVGSNVVGGMRFDTQGGGDSAEAWSRLFLYTKNWGNIPIPLKLDSEAGMSLHAKTDLYIRGKMVTLQPDDEEEGGQYVRATKLRIYPFKNIWDGNFWEFREDGIYYGGVKKV